MFFSPAKTIRYIVYLCGIAACLIFFYSCTIVKEYPVDRPFVYQTNINIEGELKTDERKELENQLEQHLHDSVRARRQRKVLFFTMIKKPPVYDSLNIAKSKLYMRALLNSLGYYRDSIYVEDTIRTVDDQQRVTIDFQVIPGKQTMIDSVWYDLGDTVAYSPRIDTLQRITNQSLDKRLIDKGKPFSKPLISAELDRLADVYRNNGYLRFSREQLSAVWDTVGREVLQFTTDPAEQLRILEALRARRQNPTADIQVRLRPGADTSRLLRYYVGTVRIFPDFNSDTAYYVPTEEILTSRRIHFISYEGLFKARKLIRFNYLDRGDLYQQSNYLRTQNKFNAIGAWRLVTIHQLPRPNSDTVDFDIKLVPAKKYSTGVNGDASINQSNLVTLSNLLGLGVNFSLVNRNFLKAANRSSLNFRYGVELTSRNDNLQTQLVNVGYTIQFPRLVPRLATLTPGVIPSEVRDNARTSLSLNAGNIDRFKYYNVSTFNASWGYEFNYKKLLVGIRFPNIEYNLVEKRELLEELIKVNKSYGYIFNDGLISSGLVNVTRPWGKDNVTNVFRFSGEAAGILSGIARNKFFPESQLYRFIKGEMEYVYTRKIRRTALAFRFFGGIGYAMNFDEDDSSNFFMPFFRQYFAGGPNSMRAWAVRRLGPGSSVKSFARDSVPDRFGDIRLEANLEYRYYMTMFFGFPLEGALFMDMGNVWFRRHNEFFGDPGSFRLGRLWTDLAIGVGTGFRIDFEFLRARFDFAWKAKNPSPDFKDRESQNEWFYRSRIRIGDKRDKDGVITHYGAQFQLGINYPF